MFVSARNNNNRRKKNRSLNTDRAAVMRVPRYMGFAPPRLATTVRFNDFITLTNVGAKVANVRFSPSNAFDVDPTVGSTSCPGFSEYALLYKMYRVQSARIKITMSNAEAFPVLMYLSPANADPGANYVIATAQTFMGQPTCRRKMIAGNSGNNTGTLAINVSTAAFGGAWNGNIIDLYSAGVGVGPTANWWVTFGTVSTTNFTVLGILCDVSIELDIEFFELATPSA